jgi:hypothetical protein
MYMSISLQGKRPKNKKDARFKKYVFQFCVFCTPGEQK